MRKKNYISVYNEGTNVKIVQQFCTTVLDQLNPSVVWLCCLSLNCYSVKSLSFHYNSTYIPNFNLISISIVKFRILPKPDHNIFTTLFLLPDHNPAIIYPEWYSCLMAAWIFFGLAWLALLINHSIDLLESVNAYLRGRQNAQIQVEEPKEQPEKGLKVEETR